MMRGKREFFDQRAKGWDSNSYSPEKQRRIADLAATFGIQAGATVLDVAAGTGVLHPHLVAAAGESGHVFAFDFSHKMIQIAGKKQRGKNLYCIQASVSAIPFSAEMFDTVVCFAAFPHFSDKLKALLEMARVARKGATVIIAHLMCRNQLLRHHGHHDPVAGDTVPEAAEMGFLCRAAGLTDPGITNRPGLYMARALKR
jgi:ubiquinone/menaquinone biosynthesis C-methylase UbiE